MSPSAHTQIHMYITRHPSLVMIVYLQNGVVFFCLFLFIASIRTHTLHFLPLFPHVYYTFFVVDGHATFFLAFVFSLPFCVEVGFTHIDAGHCHNMTFFIKVCGFLTRVRRTACVVCW